MSSDPVDDVAVARAYVRRTTEMLTSIDLQQVARVVAVVRDARARGATVYVIGNGGSASTASHFATDLAKTRDRGGAPRVRALSLTDNVALMTALSNDRSYEQVFVGQLEGLLQEGDVLVAISASGSSPSVVRAVEFARERGVTTVAFVGFDGGSLVASADVAVHVRSARGDYGPVEDVHVAIHHMIATCLAEA